MEKKQIDWENLGFGYVQTEQRYVSNYKDGKWDEGGLTEDAGVVLNECAGVLQYAQTVRQKTVRSLYSDRISMLPGWQILRDVWRCRYFRKNVFWRQSKKW